MLSAALLATALILPPWQQAIVSYNQGTQALQQEAVVEAMHHFYGSETVKDPFPPMTAHLHQNLTVAHLLHASTLPHAFRAYHYQQAEHALEQAKNARCFVQSLTGREKCIPSIKLQKLQTIINEAQQSLPQDQQLPMQTDDPQSALLQTILSLMNDRPQPEIFLPAVFEAQRSKAGCHDHPWKTVLPLYTAGVEKRRQGQKAQAILYFEQAYLVLLSPTQIAPDPEILETTQKALQALQEMELLDPVRPYRGSFPKKEVVNPW